MQTSIPGPQPAYAGPTNPQQSQEPQAPQSPQAPQQRGTSWIRRPAVLTAVAGGVLAVTAFLSGVAVGHAWDGNTTGTNGGPGGGRFGNPNFQGGPPGTNNQNGTVPGQGQQGQQVPQQGQQVPQQGSGQTQTSGVIVPTAATLPNGHQPPVIGLGVYEVWLTPATIPDPVTRSI